MDLTDLPLIPIAILLVFGAAYLLLKRKEAGLSRKLAEREQHQRQRDEGANPTEGQLPEVAEAPGEAPAMSAHSREAESGRRGWWTNPGKIFAYFSLGLLLFFWLSGFGSLQFRVIFLAVTILVIAGLAYDQHENGGPFWPRNPLVLPVRAVQGLGLAAFWTVAYVAQVIGVGIALVVGVAIIGGVLFVLFYILSLFFTGNP